jgi:hypothetical protein
MSPIIQLDIIEFNPKQVTASEHTPPEVGAADASSAIANPMHIIKALATAHCKEKE